jgi:glucan endo-1,3-alpha-glucosidase
MMSARRILKFLVSFFIGLLLISQGKPALASGPHFVFAHYMVCFATYGESVEGFKREIQEAQAAGIDGFALNVGAWNDTESYYKRRVAMMYDAAEQLGTGFKLFFSVDFGDPTNILQMIEMYASRPASFRYQSNTVLSAYGWNNVPSQGWPGVDWTNIVNQLKQDGYPVFFVPFFFSDPVRELPAYADAAGVLSKYSGLLDGVFYWGAGGLPEQLASSNAEYNRAARDFVKPFMASVAPTYWGMNQYTLSRRYYEFNGGEGLAFQWNSIITNRPDWVEICTWNDFNESTYVSPVEDAGTYFAELQTPHRNTHKGYLELSKWFISWYKTGQKPPLDRDALFYFYRTHSKDLTAANTNDVWVGWRTGDVQDTFNATVFLIAPAVLEIDSGGVRTTNSLVAGMQHVRTPFHPGTQRMTLRRDGRVILTAQGPDILASIQNYNFFPASGYVYGNEASAQLQPPGNLKVLHH